jgi:hypothetical protein
MRKHNLIALTPLLAFGVVLVVGYSWRRQKLVEKQIEDRRSYEAYLARRDEVEAHMLRILDRDRVIREAKALLAAKKQQNASPNPSAPSRRAFTQASQ